MIKDWRFLNSFMPTDYDINNFITLANNDAIFSMSAATRAINALQTALDGIAELFPGDKVPSAECLEPEFDEKNDELNNFLKEFAKGG